MKCAERVPPWLPRSACAACVENLASVCLEALTAQSAKWPMVSGLKWHLYAFVIV